MRPFKELESPLAAGRAPAVAIQLGQVQCRNPIFPYVHSDNLAVHLAQVPGKDFQGLRGLQGGNQVDDRPYDSACITGRRASRRRKLLQNAAQNQKK